MDISAFDVSEKCLDSLKRSGIATVEDVVAILEEWAVNPPGTTSVRWLKYFSEIAVQLKALGLWSANMEAAWPNIGADA